LNNNVRVSLVIALAIGLWFFSGLFVSSSTESNATPAAAKLTVVEAAWSEVQDYAPQLVLRARTEANRSVDIKAQVAGRIVAVPGAEGAIVKAGEAICQIDGEDRERRLQHARAALKQADIEFKGVQKLKQGGYQSELAIAQARTRLESARVAVERSSLDIANLSVKAPFDGVVERRPVEVGDFVQPGQLCAQVVELNPLKVTAVATERDVSTIALERQAKVTLASGESLNGAISYLSRQADPITRSFRVEATVANPQLDVLAGMSASLQIVGEPVKAHLISSSLVLLDDAGHLFVRAVDENGIVSSLPVINVGESESGVWVSGLPDRVALVTIGQNYVTDGERVTVSYRDQSSAAGVADLANNSSSKTSSGIE
jgi:multidrug efflux system membrane fusion protein